MSKYKALWEYVQHNGSQSFKLTFDEIFQITGIAIDHSFLKYKSELIEYGYKVGKISLKEQTVIFNKTVEIKRIENSSITAVKELVNRENSYLERNKI